MANMKPAPGGKYMLATPLAAYL